MRALAFLVCTLVVVVALPGCVRLPSFSPPKQPDQKKEESNGTPLSNQDFCLGGLAPGASVTEFRTRHKINADRSLGGYDFNYRWTDVYVSADGQTVDVIQSYIMYLCTNDQRLKLVDADSVSRDQVQAAYGEPSQKWMSGDEYWFYLDAAKSKAMIFQFQKDAGMKSRVVRVARFSTAQRLWYPLLGEVTSPKPIIQEDAVVGPVSLGMDVAKAEEALGEKGSEGKLSPYWKLVFDRAKVEIHFAGGAQAIYIWNDKLTTPRGIHIGSTADEVRTAYGPARVAVADRHEEYWSYESFRHNFGVVFTISDNTVTLITIVDIGYEFRPTVKQ